MKLIAVAVLVIGIVALAEGESSLEPEIASFQNFFEKLELSEIFEKIRQKRDVEDSNTVNKTKEDHGLMDGPPPPPGGHRGRPPPPNRAGGPPNGPGGPPNGPGGPPDGPGGPPHHGAGPPPRCCTIPKIINEGIRKSSNSCVSEIFGKRTKGNNKRRPEPGCYEECMFKNQSLMTSSNTVDTAKVLSLIQTTLTNVNNSDTWKPLFEKAIANCSATTNTMESNNQNCKSGAQRLIRCCHKYLIMNCPSNNWTNSTQCTEFRNHIASGPPKRDRKN